MIRHLRQLEPDVECVGYGGPKMAAAGCRLDEDLTKLAVMWFLRVLLNLHRFWDLLIRADRTFRHHRPDAVVLIDYPGFNWWIARRAKAHGIPVFYYGAPQIWAWAAWRIKKMRRLVDHVMCKLPFEAPWYRERGCHATLIGHPYFDETHDYEYDETFMAELAADASPLVTILPGSRRQEVESNLGAFLATATLIHRKVPSAKFAIASFNQVQANMAREVCRSATIPIEVYVGRTPELIRSSTACLACSGSVSLELLYHRKPTVIHYRISRFAFWVQSFFRTVRYITLVNLLASRNPFERVDHETTNRELVPFPEYLAYDDRTREMAHHINRWLTNESDRRRVVQQLDEIAEGFAVPGASQAAATYLLEHVRTHPATVHAHDRSPHAA